MTREQEINALKNRILEALRSAPKKKLTRAKLCNQLDPGLRNDLYREAEQALFDEELIDRRRGPGGGISLLSETQEADSKSQDSSESTVPVAEESSTKEQNYYEPVRQQIERYWTTQPGCKDVFVTGTALQGRRQTGGYWTRPDITLCTVSEWLFSSCPEGEVRTIEIKRFEALDVRGVYEALSHKSRSHYSYLMIVDFPKELSSKEKDNFNRIMTTADNHGIGVIKVTNYNDFDTWDFLLEPRRSNADPQAINDFLLEQFDPDQREEFASKIRAIDEGTIDKPESLCT